MSYPKQAMRFVQDVSRFSTSNVSDLLAMAGGEKKRIWLGLSCAWVVCLDAGSLYSISPLSLSRTWYRLKLEATSTAFNGRRWWFACPLCGKCYAALFWNENKFGCRKCLGLRYKSQYETFDTPFDRLCHRLKKERIAIWGDDEPDIEFLLRSSASFRRPKGMRKKTFQRKLERLNELENEWLGCAFEHFNAWKSGE